MNDRQRLTKRETISSLHHFISYLIARLDHLSHDLAVNKPHRCVDGLEVIRLQWLIPKIRKILRQQRSDETFAHANRRQRRDVPDSVILGEDKRKSWVSYTKDQRPKPKTR